MKFSLVTLLLISLSSLPVLGQGKPQKLPNTAKGFDKQYKNVFKAYEKGDEKELLERFRAFAIPEPWFTEKLGLVEGPKVFKQYLYWFRDFEIDTVKEFNRVICDYDSGCNRGQIKTRSGESNRFHESTPTHHFAHIIACRATLPDPAFLHRPWNRI